jgi:hypothetical protein
MSRAKRILAWTTIVGAACAALLLISNLLLNRRAEARFQAKIAALQAAGEPVTLSDLTPPEIPADQDAALLLAPFRPQMEGWRQQWREIWFESRDTPRREFVCDGNLTEDGYQALHDLWTRYEGLWSVMQQAAERSGYRSRVDFSVPVAQYIEGGSDQFAMPPNAMFFAEQRVQLLEYEGRRDEALQACLVMFRLARHVEREPTLIGYHYSRFWRHFAAQAASRVLLDGPVSPDVQRALEEELCLHDDRETFLWTIRTERAEGLDTFRALLRGDPFEAYDSLHDERNKGILRTMARWLAPLMRWRVWNEACDFIDMTGYALDFGMAPFYVVREDLPDPPKDYEQSGSITAFAFRQIWMFRQTAETERAYLRCLRILNALPRDGGHTEDVSSLLTNLGLPPEACIDPYDGQPLRIKRNERGWLVYSVGPNLRDDGGELGYILHERDIAIGATTSPEDP